MWPHLVTTVQSSADVREEENMERKEDMGVCDGGDERRSWGRTLSRPFPYWGLSFLLCKMGTRSARIPRGCEGIANLGSPGAQPRLSP